MADKKLNSIKFPDLADRYILDAGKVNYNDTDAFADNTVGKALKNVDDSLATKAEIDGYYEEMTVGDAEQLVASQYVDNAVPYVFRTTGGSADVGNREYVDAIVGGSIAWNQLIRNADLTVNNTTKVYDSTTNTTTFTPTSYTNNASGGFKSGALINGHKHLLLADYYADYAVNARIGSAYATSTSQVYRAIPAETWTTVSGVILCSEGTASTAAVFYTTMSTSGWTDGTFKIRNPQVFDLTQMFGSTVADYIYSLETNNAGDGVAFFKALFPKPYYAYNAGTLMHVNASSHDTVGFNLLDVENDRSSQMNYSDGSISNNAVDSITTFRLSIEALDSNNNVIKQVYYQYGHDTDGRLVRTFTAPMNGTYSTLRFKHNGTILDLYLFSVPSGRLIGGQTYCLSYKVDGGNPSVVGGLKLTNVNINLSWSGYRNGEYEAYSKHAYPLDSTLTLRGVPKLDGSNNLYYDGDTYEYDGTVTRRFAVVDMGTLRWIKNADTAFYSVDITDFLQVRTVGVQHFGNVICSKYTPTYDTPNAVSGEFALFYNAGYSGYRLFAYDSAFSGLTAEQVKSALSGVMLVYELATPTTETADPYQQIQICNDFGTEEFVVTEQSGVAVPVGHTTRFPANLRDKLQHLPDLATNDGTYAILQSNKQMSLTQIPTAVAELPDAPTTDGTYTLTCTVSGGEATYTWEA